MNAIRLSLAAACVAVSFVGCSATDPSVQTQSSVTIIAAPPAMTGVSGAAVVCSEVKGAMNDSTSAKAPGSSTPVAERVKQVLDRSYELMSTMADVAPEEIRQQVVVLRDYYKTQIESGLGAGAPSEVAEAEATLNEWIDHTCGFPLKLGSG